jgi:hypothetical protein
MRSLTGLPEIKKSPLQVRGLLMVGDSAETVAAAEEATVTASRGDAHVGLAAGC